MQEIKELLALLGDAGNVGKLLAGVLVGLTVSVVLVAKLRDLFPKPTVGFDPARATDAGGDRLLLLVDKLMANEDLLRKRLDALEVKAVRIEALEVEKAAMAQEMTELRVTLALVRNQRRRLIELLWGLKEGKLAFDAIAAADIDGEPA